MLDRLNRAVLDHPVIVLLAGIAITGLLAWHLPGLRFSSSSDEFFIHGDPDRQYYEKAKKLFGNDQVIVIAMVAPEGETIFTKERIAKLDRLTRAVGAIEGVQNSLSLTNATTIQAPYDPEGGFRRVIEVRKLVPHLPKYQADLSILKSDLKLNPLYKDNLVSEDGRAAAVVAFVQDFDEQSDRYDQVVGDIRAIVSQEKGPERFYTAGVPETRVEMGLTMVKDIKILMPLTFLLIVIALWLSYRKPSGVLLPMAIIIMTTLWSMGFMEAAGLPITMVSMILPPLMLALGSSYSIHLMSEYLGQQRPGRNPRDTLASCMRMVSLPVVVCGITTGAGFASLSINDIPAIRELGGAAVAGILFTVLISLMVMPAALLIFKPTGMLPGRIHEGRIFRMLERLAYFDQNRPKTIVAISIVIALVSIAGIFLVRVDTDFLSFFPKNSEIRVSAEAQSRYLAGAAPFSIVIESDRPGTFKHPEMLNRLAELQHWSETQVEGIDSTMSIADYIKLLYQAMHGNDKDFYRIPDTVREVGQILLLYATSSSPNDFAPYVTPDYSAANILVRSRLVGSTETSRAINEIEKKAKELFSAPHGKMATDQMQDPADADGEEVVSWGQADKSEESFAWPDIETRVTGIIYLMNKSADAVSHGQVIGLATALVVIFLVMSLLFLSPKIGLLAMLPNLFPILALFGLMGYTGITLNFSTSLIAAIALGIGVDDTIHYINRYNREAKRSRDRSAALYNSLTKVGKPMIYTSATLLLGFSILAVSDFVPIKQFGLLSAVTIAVALAANLVILPAVMDKVKLVTLWDLLSLEIGDSPARYVKIFHGLSTHQAKVAVLMGHVEEYKDGEFLNAHDKHGSELYTLLKGGLDIVMGEGEHEISIALLREGDIVGERTMRSEGERVAQARAIGDVKVLVIDDEIMDRLEKRYPRISSKIYYNIVQELRHHLQLTATQLLAANEIIKEMRENKASSQ